MIDIDDTVPRDERFVASGKITVAVQDGFILFGFIHANGREDWSKMDAHDTRELIKSLNKAIEAAECGMVQ